jgi:hypothetical protein
MNDAEVYRELTRNPAKMLVLVREKRIKSKLAHVIERMERQFK